MTAAETPKDPRDEAVDEALNNPQVAEEEQRPDLNAERDERCKPVALALIALLASKDNLYVGQIEHAKAIEFYSDLYMEAVPILQEHNVRMDEIKYVFQMALQTIDGLSAAADKTMTDQETTQKAAVSVFKILAGQSDLPMGTIDDKAAMSSYYEELYKGAIEDKISVGANKYVLGIMAQGLQLLQERIDTTLQLMYDRSVAYMWQKPDTGDVTINDLDKKLRELVGAEKATEKSTGEEAVDEDVDSK